MKILVVLLAAVACVVAEPIYRYDWPGLYTGSVVPSTYPFYHPYFKSQYFDQGLFGGSRYGHIEPGQSHHVVQDALGNKVGGYSYFNPEGKLIRTSYVADAGGFRVTSNDLPVAPTGPIPDTPEVAAAKTAHLAEVEKIKNRSRREAPVTKDGFLPDTPEVAAAKEKHLLEVEAAKLRSLYPVLPIAPIDYRFGAPISSVLPTFPRSIPYITKDGSLDYKGIYGFHPYLF